MRVCGMPHLVRAAIGSRNSWQHPTLSRSQPKTAIYMQPVSGDLVRTAGWAGDRISSTEYICFKLRIQTQGLWLQASHLND